MLFARKIQTFQEYISVSLKLWDQNKWDVHWEAVRL